jgi:hypothetical protein
MVCDIYCVVPSLLPLVPEMCDKGAQCQTARRPGERGWAPTTVCVGIKGRHARVCYESNFTKRPKLCFKLRHGSIPFAPVQH